MTTIEITPAQLHGLSLAMSSEETRYYLQGICYQQESGANTAAMVATDGHRLHAMRVEAPAREARRVIIPAELIKSALAIADKRSPRKIMLTLYDARAAVTLATKHGTEGVTISAPYTGGDYPTWERVIPALPTGIVRMQAGYAIHPAYAADAVAMFGGDAKKQSAVLLGDDEHGGRGEAVYVVASAAQLAEVQAFCAGNLGRVAVVMPRRV